MEFKIGNKTLSFGSKPTAATKQSGGTIITQLAKEFSDRSRVDIKKWRDAIMAAENPDNPRWMLYQDLIDNLMTDGHLQAVKTVRKAATLSNRFYIRDRKTGKEIEDKSDLLNTEWFYNLVDKLLDSVFFGYTVMELTDPATLEWQMWPRRNIAPQLHRLYFEAGGDKHITYNDPAFAKNVIFLYNQNLFGLLNDIVPQLIWKRNAQQTWADFSERFGIPLISATTNKSDAKELNKIEAMLRALGQSAQALLPEGTTITIHDQATKGDPYNIYKEQIKTSNDEISKRVVGGTMVIENGSSRSQSEVHERTLDYKIAESDRRMIEFFVNGRLKPLLKTKGLSLADNEEFVYDRSEDLSLGEHWKIVNEALNHFDVDENWLSTQFNIPITGRRETPSFTPGASMTRNFQ